MIRGILIDPYAQEIVEVDYSGDWRDIKTFLQCDIFTTVYMPDTYDSIYVDDEGLYVENQRFFKFASYPQPLAGMGLVLGCNELGESVSCESTLERVKAQVEWCEEGTSVEPKLTFVSLDGDASDSSWKDEAWKLTFLDEKDKDKEKFIEFLFNNYVDKHPDFKRWLIAEDTYFMENNLPPRENNLPPMENNLPRKEKK